LTEVDSIQDPSCDQIRVARRELQQGVVLAVSGEIDLATVPTVERELMLAEETHDLIAIDLSSVSFMDSTGLRMIVDANRRLHERGGRLLIVQGPLQVSRLFELTGVTSLIAVVPDEIGLERFVAERNDSRPSLPSH
jgi:anti-anti-sigma factor